MQRFIALCTVLAAFAMPSMALAHSGNITADCEAAHFVWTNFPSGTNTVTYFVQVDNTTPQQGSTTFTGNHGSFDVPLLLSRIGGTHSVHAISTWTADNGGKAEVTVTIDCGRPPVADTPVVDTPVTPTDLPPVTLIPGKPIITTKIKCAYGVKRYDSRHHRLRDSKGHKIALCRSKPKPPVFRTPKFTG